MRQLTRLTTSLLFTAAALTQLSGDASAQTGYATALASGDFNGDGYIDQAIGNPAVDDYHQSNTYRNAGQVTVKYGSHTGLLSTALQQSFSPKSDGLLVGSSASYLYFGKSLAAGDFNGDGYCDLAVGSPYERINGSRHAGGVVVLYGSMWGLKTNNARKLSQDSYGVAGVAESNDIFGATLAAGDFNGDGEDDLVIGAPGEDLGSINAAGMIHVLWGRPWGITTSYDLSFHQDSPSVPGQAEEDDAFGSALAVGDFDGDQLDDLAVGVPGEGLFGSGLYAGMVNLFRGRPSGLSASSRTLSQFRSIPPVFDWMAETADRFGSSLAAGDINGDGRDDLVAGSTGEKLGSAYYAGAVDIILFKAGSNFPVLRQTHLHQNTTGVTGAAEAADSFGMTLALGDLDDDGYADLVVGVQREDIGSVTD
ncbi:MAG: FG-GAP-like repeat-containing protein [Planctomycetes bacterium]|nr:FG-GAP-like repeat-containing protein [Planctomycetota bacterium]